MKIAPTLVISCMLGLSAFAVPQNVQGSQLQTDHAQKVKPVTIKVLLAKQKDNLYLEVKGRYQIYSPVDDLLLVSGALAKQDRMTVRENGIHWGENYPGIFQMRIVPGDSQTTILVNGTQYRGCVEVHVVDGKFNVVNEIDIDSYLKSVLSSQFSDEMHPEVMEALAIVARTNAYARVFRSPQSYWHVDADEIQYHGNAVALLNPHVDRAIENTRHVVMLYQNAPFAAAWTKNSAGKTADFSTVFRKKALVPPGIIATIAAKDRENSSWNFRMTKAHIARLSGISALKKCELYIDETSQKVYGMKISDGSQTKTLDFFQMQKVFGMDKLRSNDFSIQQQGDWVTFKGYGEGPGVGLCLYSAQKMAVLGEKAGKILPTFFPGSKIESIRNPQDLFSRTVQKDI